MGNSYLRQVFEAMACRWDATITAGLLQVRGPEMHIEDIAAQKRTSVADRGFRSLPFGDVARPSCHGNDAERYYALGVAPSVAGCNDNLAMVEFAKDLRAYFVFRPWSYEEDAIDVLRALDLKARDVDVLVCNEYCGLVAPPKRAFGLTTEEAVLGERRDACSGPRSAAGPATRDRRSSTSTACAARRLSTKRNAGEDRRASQVRATLKAQMKRDVGHAYGATNAVLRDDNHPCLPGIPDDEVDILFSALADRGHAQRLGYVPAHKEEFRRAPPPEDARRATSTTKAPELKGRCGRPRRGGERARRAVQNEEECDKKHHCTYNEKRGCKPKKHEAPSR
ncbi:hypothetical protein JL720_10990 [Aureococcus anophagefferens]|nr:hypothetical protein JL720_10990 [Aureococcus anophagefferens]